MMKKKYEMRGDRVLLLSDYYSPEEILNREQIENAIEYTTRIKNLFATEQAYQDQLDKYEGALKFLDEALGDDPSAYYSTDDQVRSGYEDAKIDSPCGPLD